MHSGRRPNSKILQMSASALSRTTAGRMLVCGRNLAVASVMVMVMANSLGKNRRAVESVRRRRLAARLADTSTIARPTDGPLFPEHVPSQAARCGLAGSQGAGRVIQFKPRRLPGILAG